jgi:ribonuclease HII
MRICGLDEVGRGSLAGPLVAAAVILNLKFEIYNLKLRDSKKLNQNQRELLYNAILDSGSLVKTEVISVRKINNRGIGWANKQVFCNLIKRIEADEYIVDGNLKIKGAISVIKADTKIPEVMAASIVAKVTRDRMMRELHKDFPEYGWNKNVGYGTKSHIEAIRKYGETKHHRSAFVRTALKRPLP